MPAGHVQVAVDGFGKDVDADSLVSTEAGGPTVYRQNVVISDPTTYANKAGVTAAGAVKVDGSAVTQPISGTVSIGAGSVVIGHVIADSGSTTAVTGNVTVIQASGANLHTVLDSGTVTTITNPVIVLGAYADNSATTTFKAGVLPARANASAPSWTETNQVPLSTDLFGYVRTTGPVTGTVSIFNDEMLLELKRQTVCLQLLCADHGIQVDEGVAV